MIQALLIVGLSFFNPQVPADSIGIQTIDGKVFVIHKVEEKETLYGISRRYGTTVDVIVQYNPNADEGLSVGQTLKVPYSGRTATRPKTTTTTGGRIIHSVADGETLYSIARAYEVSVDDIKQWNNLSANSLSVGQELTIKKTGSASSASSVTTPPAQPANLQKGVHQVAAKETMYSISRQYNISVDDLKRWNNLQGNDLSVGQVLFVSPPKNTNTGVTEERQPVTTPPVTNNTPVTETPRVETQQQKEPAHKEPPVTQQPVTTNTTPPPATTNTITISEGVKGSDEVVQSGLAELIEGTEGNRKYLALHRTVPIGTILKVRNEMNNREVFVRVMGKLPDTALTDKLIIKISKSAYDRLGAIDPRFRVEITYYK